MPQTVVTVVSGTAGGLDVLFQNRVLEIAKQGGGVTPEVLEPGKALDIVIEGYSEALAKNLRDKFSQLIGFDIFVQVLDEYRKKKLLVADMDATMIEGETLDELAGHFGLHDKIAPITAAAMRGEIDFKAALEQRVALLRGMPVGALQETLDKVRYSKGASTLIKTMNRYGAKCVLISGGFDFFTRPVAQTLGFYKNIGNRLGIAADKLTGEVIPPIVDKHTKEHTVMLEAQMLQIDLRATVAVGDGANDIPMLQKAGAGVGYFGKPAVVAATPYQIRFTDLTSILYMQGYKGREFAV